MTQAAQLTRRKNQTKTGGQFEKAEKGAKSDDNIGGQSILVHSVLRTASNRLTSKNKVEHFGGF